MVRPVEASLNNLACYLTEMGSLQRTRLVVIRRLFGEVKERWMRDKWGWALVRVILKSYMRRSMRIGSGLMRKKRSMKGGIIEIIGDEDAEAVEMLMN